MDQKLQMDGGKVILNQEREDTFFQRDFPRDTGTWSFLPLYVRLGVSDQRVSCLMPSPAGVPAPQAILFLQY